MTPRDIEKLKAIGYSVPSDGVAYDCYLDGEDILEYRDWEFEDMAWGYCKVHAQSPGGMKITMAAKVNWLISRCHDAALAALFKDVSPGLDFKAEVAVDALFWTVP